MISLFKKNFFLCAFLCFVNAYSMEPLNTTDEISYSVDDSTYNTETSVGNSNMETYGDLSGWSWGATAEGAYISFGSHSNVDYPTYDSGETGGSGMSHDHSTNHDYPTNYDGDKQSQQDFAQDSRQENDRYEQETQQRDKQSSWRDNASTSNTNSNSKPNANSTQKNKSVSQEKQTFHKPYNDPIKTLEKNLQSPEYKKRCEDYRAILQKSLHNKGADKRIIEKQIAVINTILGNGSMGRMLNIVKNGSLKDAIKMFDTLKNMSPWKQKISFLVDDKTVAQKEFNDVVGIDIMKVAESSLIARADYLKAYGVSSESTQLYIRHSLRPMQLQGDKKGLEQVRAQIASQIKKMDPNYNLQTKAMLVAIDSLLSDPLTDIFDIIKNADVDIARKELGAFQMQLLHHFETQNFKTMDEIKADMMEREGVDLLAAANKCFESRPDYQSYQEKIAQQKADASKEKTNNQVLANDEQATTNNNQVPPNINNIDKGSIPKNNNNGINQEKPNQGSKSKGYSEEIDDILDEKSAGSFEDATDTMPQEQDDDFFYDEYSGVDAEPYILKPNKRIVADQDENTNVSNARKEARIFVEDNPQYSRQVIYILDPVVCETLQARGIHSGQFTVCVGNEVQQQIHAEFVSILNDTVNIPSNESTQPLLDVIETCAHAGNVYVKQNDTDKAFTFANCAWAALDCANAVCENGFNLTQEMIADITKGLVEGSINALQNNVNMVLDPIGTATNIAESFVHLGYCFGKLMEPIMYFDGDNEIDWDVAAAMNEEWAENVQGVIDAASQVTLEGATAFATEMLLSPKITKMGVNFIAHYAKPTVAQMTKLGQTVKDKVANKAEKIANAVRHNIGPRPVGVTHEGIKIPVSDVPKKGDDLYNAMGKNGNNHNKKPTFNDIKNEVSKDSKIQESVLRKNMIKPGPNGLYEDASYHHKNSSGIKNPAPTDGQHALDNSLKIEGKNSSSRIAISHDEFVVLMEDFPNKFHGHVRNWNDLDDLTQNTLIKAGLVTHRGKIIK